MADKKYSPFKIFHHQKKLSSFLDGKIISPVYVRVKPTNKCNHSCYYCAYDSENPTVQELGRKDEIPQSKLMQILDDFKEMGVKAVTYSGGGEPLMHPNILDVLRKTIDYGIDLSIITNGQKLNEEKAELLKYAKWIRVSMDSCNAETFSATRKRPESWFYELTSNIRTFSSTKPDSCVLGINFVIQEKNFREVYDSIRFFRDLGVDNVKIAPRHIPEDSQKYHEPFMETVIEQIRKAKEVISGIEIHDDYENGIKLSTENNREYSRCYIMQTIPAIGADQNVYFCHDKAWIGDKNGILGSVKEQSFRELWFSEDARNKFQSFNPAERCRHHCTNDRKNIAINAFLTNPDCASELKSEDDEHKNFV
jgi:MoaA/NifB/PqqE/SkfB family radical SAM enzyme